MATTPFPDVDLPDVHATTTRSDGCITVALVGEVDLDLRDYFDAVVDLVARTGDRVEVDLSQVTFSCAEGVRFLTTLRSVAPDGVVHVIAMSPVVESLLSSCGFHAPADAGLALETG